MENEPQNEPQDAYIPGDDGEALQPFDVREQSNRAGMIKFVGGLVFLLALAFIVSKLFASGTRDREQTPRITADNTPYKETPLNSGGAETPNQDKKIYDVLNGDEVETKIKTIPVSEEPLEKPKPQKPAANIIIKEKQPATASSKQEKKKPAKMEPPRPVKKPAPDKVTKPVAKPKPAISGGYVVQIASLRSRSEAQAMWDKLTVKMGDIISSDYYADIKRADLGARGVYYRLRIGGVGERETAKALCRRLKAKNQDCIVTKK